MTIAELRSAYEVRSSKVSDIVRQLALGGIGIIWAFRTGTVDAPLLDRRLVLAALFITLALASDLLHYLVGTIIWFCRFRQMEKLKEAKGEEPNQDHSEYLTWPTWALFYLKTGFVLFAYLFFLLPYFVQKAGISAGAK